MLEVKSIKDILQLAVRVSASDVHLKTYSVPTFRINGQLVKVDELGLQQPQDMNVILKTVLNEEQVERFHKNNEMDLAYSLPGVGRFRVNVFIQRGSVGMVFRTIPMDIKSVEELLLPDVIKDIANMRRGLVLVTGTTGSGKSTTLAAMVQKINTTRTSHIMTIEDPIEFLVRDLQSIVNQREIGLDTKTFTGALRAALRQDPDVIMVGEMRDLETIEIALTAAETGHLVFSTLHTVDAVETINRIIGVFPPHQQSQIRQQLASVLKAVVSQRLIRKGDKKGRVPAVEVLINTQLVHEIIMDPSRLKELRSVIEKGHSAYGMQTFDQSIFSLYKKNLITKEEALENATSPEDLLLRMKGVAISGDGDWGVFDKENAAYNEKPEDAD